jgi:hypothetical protein
VAKTPKNTPTKIYFVLHSTTKISSGTYKNKRYSTSGKTANSAS